VWVQQNSMQREAWGQTSEATEEGGVGANGWDQGEATGGQTLVACVIALCLARLSWWVGAAGWEEREGNRCLYTMTSAGKYEATFKECEMSILQRP
jgi:hypothetical protein